MVANPPQGSDDDDWQAAVENVRPLKPHTGLTRDKPQTASKTPPVGIRPRAIEAPRPPAGERTISGRQMDKGTEKKFKRGQVAIEGRLDLHGFTLAQAQDRLKNFVIRAHGAGKRCVLVVTGKGDLPNPDDDTGSRRGRIRREFPDWLMQPPLNHLVLKAVSAKPLDGGAGAFYLYLRRDRDR